MSLDPDLAAFLKLVEANVISGSKPMMHELTPTQERDQSNYSPQEVQNASLFDLLHRVNNE